MLCMLHGPLPKRYLKGLQISCHYPDVQMELKQSPIISIQSNTAMFGCSFGLWEKSIHCQDTTHSTHALAIDWAAV